MTSRILIVEDDDDVVNLATHWLERAGYTVEHAGDGQAALALLKNQPLPALVLLDVMLPKIDGFEILRLIRSNPHTKALPVAMVTSFSRDKDAQRGRQLGANDYIVKPLAELDFLERVAAALKGAQKPR
jgi:DNA-binding response OmpR family regulator